MTSTTPTRFAAILAELSDPLRMEDEHTRNGHNPFALATLADCYSPDTSDSPGARFLARIARDVAEHVDTEGPGETVADAVRDLTDGDAAHEIADSTVPIYTHDRWATFVDLGAYNEDISELGELDGDDLTGAAGVALYLIARHLVSALAEELSEALDEDTDEQEPAYVTPHNAPGTVYCSRDGVVPEQDSGGCRLCDERGDSYSRV